MFIVRCELFEPGSDGPDEALPTATRVVLETESLQLARFALENCKTNPYVVRAWMTRLRPSSSARSQANSRQPS